MEHFLFLILSQRMLATTPASQLMGYWPHPRPLHTWKWNVRVCSLVKGSIFVLPYSHSNFNIFSPNQGCTGLEHVLACPIFCDKFSAFTTDPARVGRMSRETYLPTGMEGVIVCPVQADPPVLYVNWTKDGNNLNLDNVSYVTTKQSVSCSGSCHKLLTCVINHFE